MTGRNAGRSTVSPGPMTASGDLKKVLSGRVGVICTLSIKLPLPHRTLPGRGTGARNCTWSMGITVPPLSAASRLLRNSSKLTMMRSM